MAWIQIAYRHLWRLIGSHSVDAAKEGGYVVQCVPVEQSQRCGRRRHHHGFSLDFTPLDWFGRFPLSVRLVTPARAAEGSASDRYELLVSA